MYRDVIDVSTGDCIQIIDDKTLIVYTTSTSTETYKLISDKYFKISENTSATPVDSSVTCYTTAQIQQLPSSYDFITPIFHLMAIISIIAIFYIAYRLLIYPFFRKI